MVRLREFFGGEQATMVRNVASQRLLASDEQRKEAAERHTASRWASKRTPDNENPQPKRLGVGADYHG